jgi:serine/threonine-protein kinase
MAMSPQRWRQIERLFQAALQEEPVHRGAFVGQAAGSDQELRREVESLLADLRSRDDLLDRPAWQAIGMPEAPSVEGRFRAGDVLAGRYRIVAPLGCGGMGEVYCAIDLVLEQKVALKFLPAILAQDPGALNRLYNEVRLARQVGHPNVCRVYDVVEAQGFRFLTMEHIDGEDLRSLLLRIGRVAPEKASEIARRLCAGVAAAHDRGVLHRDLKPANIMIDARGNVRIADFGLAVLADLRQTHDPGSGTPSYMAPEQLAGDEVTARSDIYSLGLVLCEVFGGRHPFKGCDTGELLPLKRQDPAELVLEMTAGPDVERAVRRCLEPDPGRRPESATALAVELSGGDALDWTVAAGETPNPELVARAGAAAGLQPRIAVACLSIAIASLGVFAWITPRIGVLGGTRVEPPDALARTARETLSSFGLNTRFRHQASRFSYDPSVFTHEIDGNALQFWHRGSPDWMVPNDLTGVLSLSNPPDALPGMVTTKWDMAGRLLYLRALPSDDGGSGTSPADVWRRLFAAAGLEPSRFQPVESGWIPAPGWDARGSWTGMSEQGKERPVRIEAAAWRGRPVYFDVVPAWRADWGSQPVPAAQRMGASQLAVFVLLFAVSAMLARRNVRLGRGDRRGSFRIAVFVFAGVFSTAAFRAEHVPDIREFTVLAMHLSWAGFVTGGFWTVYMALEPYVRRRWPHAIVSWTRVLSGRFRDPLVGREILVGVAFGSASLVLITIAAMVSGVGSPWLPSFWILSGSRYTLAYASGNAVDAVLRGLTLIFLVFCSKVFLRSIWFAVFGIGALAFVFSPPMAATPSVGTVILGLLAVGCALLLLRGGLVSAITAIFVTTLMIGLPINGDLTTPATGQSIVILLSFVGLALFGFRSAMAGRRIFNLDL